MAEYSIELDCPPGNPRPDDLLPGVLAETGLTADDFDNVGRFFGHWTWVLKAGREDVYAAVQPTVKERVVALYNAGYIRYGSW